MLQAEFIQNCSSDSEVLRFYAEREGCWKKGGRSIKKAIADLEMVAWFPFTMKNLNNKQYFDVERMKYNGELYAIATNSGINYIFRIYVIN